MVHIGTEAVELQHGSAHQRLSALKSILPPRKVLVLRDSSNEGCHTHAVCGRAAPGCRRSPGRHPSNHESRSTSVPSVLIVWA